MRVCDMGIRDIAKCLITEFNNDIHAINDQGIDAFTLAVRGEEYDILELLYKKTVSSDKIAGKLEKNGINLAIHVATNAELDDPQRMLNFLIVELDLVPEMPWQGAILCENKETIHSLIQKELPEKYQLEKLFIEKDCVICAVNKPDCVFISCQHVCVCKDCISEGYKNFRTCPICRKEITHVYKKPENQSDTNENQNTMN